MNSYVTLYDNIYTKEACQSLIDKFETYHEVWLPEQHTYKDGWHMRFTQIKLADHQVFAKENETLHDLFLQGISAYKKKCYQGSPMAW